MPTQQRAEPFDHPGWYFELKYDGFRALAYFERGKCSLVSRNGHQFHSFARLADSLKGAIQQDAVLDGEIVCVDDRGRPQFNDLLLRRGDPAFFAFDTLWCNGRDFHNDAFTDRKLELRRVLGKQDPASRLLYVDHIHESGRALFQQACELDLEGIIAKYAFGTYESVRENSTWVKIRNPNYSQWVGRAELFERDRHSEPVAGWHACTVVWEEQERKTRRNEPLTAAQ